MKKLFWAAGFVFLLLQTPAHAQAVRTWVSGTGDDANPCSITSPCRTFAGAISKTQAGGVISVFSALTGNGSDGQAMTPEGLK